MSTAALTKEQQVIAIEYNSLTCCCSQCLLKDTNQPTAQLLSMLHTNSKPPEDSTLLLV